MWTQKEESPFIYCYRLLLLLV